ncbi:MAG: RluA family pseudouridine synthase [Spirochaetales bacterium]|nr:RluA family pseudouridine synthase [Spirochaetales bacterium]
MEKKIYEIKENDDGRRIDRILRKMYPSVSLGVIYKALRKGDIRLNKKKIKQNETVHCGDVLSIDAFFSSTEQKEEKEKKENLYFKDRDFIKPLIIFENDNILVINKPAGLVVHGDNSLEKRVKSYLIPSISPSLSFEPGPVHRLDRNTSGLIVFSKSLKGAQEISDIFQQNLCEKYYLGLFEGHIENEAEWKDGLFRDKAKKKTFFSDDPEAKHAITKVKPLISSKRQTLALCTIKTGITHQIRAQGMFHNFPLLGDKKYGSTLSSAYNAHYILHAWGLRFYTYNRIIGRTSLFASLPPKLYKKLSVMFGSKMFKDTLAFALKNISK